MFKTVEIMNDERGIEKDKGNGVLPCVTNRTFKCLKCKNYSIKVVNEEGGTSRVCNAKINDPRIIVNLDAPNCTDYVYGW